MIFLKHVYNDLKKSLSQCSTCTKPKPVSFYKVVATVGPMLGGENQIYVVACAQQINFLWPNTEVIG